MFQNNNSKGNSCFQTPFFTQLKEKEVLHKNIINPNSLEFSSIDKQADAYSESLPLLNDSIPSNNYRLQQSYLKIHQPNKFEKIKTPMPTQRTYKKDEIKKLLYKFIDDIDINHNVEYLNSQFINKLQGILSMKRVKVSRKENIGKSKTQRNLKTQKSVKSDRSLKSERSLSQKDNKQVSKWVKLKNGQERKIRVEKLTRDQSLKKISKTYKNRIIY